MSRALWKRVAQAASLFLLILLMALPGILFWPAGSFLDDLFEKTIVDLVVAIGIVPAIQVAGSQIQGKLAPQATFLRALLLWAAWSVPGAAIGGWTAVATIPEDAGLGGIAVYLLAPMYGLGFVAGLVALGLKGIRARSGPVAAA